jgi:hypothetical protein
MAGRMWLGTDGSAPTDVGDIDNYSGAVSIPASTDELFYPQTAPVGPSVNALTALAAVDLNLLSVMRGVTYSLGGSGNHLTVDADKVDYRGTSGKLWLKSGSNTTDWVIINSTASDPLAHDCFSFTGATLTHLDLLRGWGTLEASSTVTEFIVGQLGLGVTEAKLTIDGSATSLPLGIQYAGIVSASSAVTTVEIHGGTWSQLAGVPTTIKQSSGMSIWKKSGTITTVYALKDAVLDFTQADGVTTITTLYKHPTARVLGWNPENNGIVIVTNPRIIPSEY